MYYKYRNLGGNSNVSSYSIGFDSIIVEFKDRSRYLYTYYSTSTAGVEHMKYLAKRGVGLNSYISRVVRKRYARRLR